MSAHHSPRLAKKVALIGWDAADWQVIQPLLDAGLMPNLQKLVERGVMGKIATLEPALSPILWTSIATGKRGDDHEILGFLEPDPISGTVRPVSSFSRKGKALWNILHQSGLRSLVLNWFAGHPAEPIQGAYVSNAYRSATQPHGAPWPLPQGSIHPASHEKVLKDLRIHPGDLTGDDLLPFIPQLARVDQKEDKRPLLLASILAENISVHAATTWLMENEPWDFLAAYFDTIDHAGHVFMPFYPPRMEHVSEQDFEIYKDVINGVYCFQDMMLGRIAQLAGPDATIIVVSDHGFHSGHLRPTRAPALKNDMPLRWHRSHGVLCMAGPGIRQDDLVYGAGLLDVAPTILTLFGLPCGQDMPGRLLAEAFENPIALERIPSWEEVPGECGMSQGGGEQDIWEASAVIAQLADLGYIDTVSEGAQGILRTIRMDREFNLVRVHLSHGRVADATALLESLVQEEPKQPAYSLYLAQCYYELGRMADCRSIVERVLSEDANRPLANVIQGNLDLAEGRMEDGLKWLLRAEESGQTPPLLRFVIGRVYAKFKRWDDAERSFRWVLEVDADCAEAWAGLARCLLEKRKFKAAADAAMDAIGLRFDLPGSHYVLGVALARLGRADRAIQAFEACLRLAPQTKGAHEWLARLHRKSAGDLEKAGRRRAGPRKLSVPAQ